MDLNEWTKTGITIITTLGSTLGISKIWSYLRAKNNNETDILKQQLDNEHEDIETLKMKLEVQKNKNATLQKEIDMFDKKINTLELSLDRAENMIKVMRVVIVNLSKDRPELIKIMNDLESQDPKPPKKP